MRQMSDTLASAHALSFSTREILEVVEPTGDKRPLRFARRVTVRRPDRLLFALHGTEGTQLEVAAFYDGEAVSLRSDLRRVWAQADVPATLDEMFDDVARRFSLPVPVADVLYDSPYDALLGTDAAGGFVGRETIDGVECVELAYEDEFVEVRLWLPASGQALPRRLKIVYRQTPGQPMSQMTFADWNLDAEVADGMFAFEPPQDYGRVEVQEFINGLVPASAAAPAATFEPSEPAPR